MIPIRGFRRKDGRIGIRNHLVVLSTVVCANEAAGAIARRFPRAVALTHPAGCCLLGKDLEQFRRTILGLATNPNVGAVLVIGLGCEQLDAHKVAAEIAATGRAAASLVIQECRGTRPTVRQGVALVRKMARRLDAQKPVSATVADLVLGTECGGSDFSSGLVANPVLGQVSDRVIAKGGTVILSETTELIGAEHILAHRAVNRRVARDILRIVKRVEDEAHASGTDIRGTQPTPGNMAGGLTTIEEKSLACVHKGGSGRVRGVVEFAEPVRGKGLWIMDTPGQDVESITGMVAGGSQVVIFTTGRGTPTGCPLAPVIKLTGNPVTARNLSDHIDFNAGDVLVGKQTIEDAGKKLFALLIATARGRRTCAERLGHNELALNRIGRTY